MKPNRNRWIYGLTLLGAFALAWAYVQRFAVVERYEDYVQDKAAIRQAQSELMSLQAEYNRLKQQNHQMGSDPLAREASIRRIQRKARPGEIVIHFEDGPAASPAGSQEQEVLSEQHKDK